MAVLVFFMFVAIIVAAIIKSMMGGHHAGLETVHKTNTATGAAVVTETASGASVTATETEESVDSDLSGQEMQIRQKTDLSADEGI